MNAKNKHVFIKSSLRIFETGVHAKDEFLQTSNIRMRPFNVKGEVVQLYDQT